MRSIAKKIRNLARKLTLRSVVLCVLSVSVFGFFFCANMNMMHLPTSHDHHGSAMAMTNCDDASLLPCTMNVSDHLAEWERLFIALSNTIFSDLLLGAAILVTIFNVLHSRLLFAIPQRHKFYIANSPIAKLHNYFLRLFAKGLLARKLYA